MHELGIAQDLFKIIEEKARENSLKSVTKIRVKVGVASGIDKDFLRHSFIDHIFPKSIAAGAELEFMEEPLTARCKDCQKTIVTQESPTSGCPACGSVNIEITKGKDVYIENIEGE